jgi:hypothetical protein
VVTSTTVLGGFYLVMYEAAHIYFGRLGITPEQAGLSRDAIAGGALAFAAVYVGLLMPAAAAAVLVFRLVTKSRRDLLALAAAFLAGIGALSVLSQIQSSQIHPLLLVAMLVASVIGVMVGVLAGVIVNLAAGRVASARRRWSVEWRRVRLLLVAALLAGVSLYLIGVLQDRANAAGDDVLRHGSSVQNFFGMPIVDLLGVRTVAVSPCLMDLGDEGTPAHLGTAFIVGRSGGRVYLVAVAGPAGFRHIPAGHHVTFSVADGAIRALDLESRASPSATC